nr:T9SS type A sorting domain-containing protein [Bacteroidota bacterium]
YENETIFGLEDMVVPTVLVSPNPVTDILQFDVTGGVISEVTGYDVSGRLLLRAAGPLSQVDVSGLPNGMLFVHIVTEDGSQVVKVVKESSSK